MKDVTATSFGLVIAFLLPGLTGLYALSYWVPEVNALLNQMWTAETSAGSFLLITLAALTIGLQVTLIRWLLFERWLCREQTLSAREFQALAKEAMLPAYEAAVDQHYRYHQFWGGMTVVLPVLFVGWAVRSWATETMFMQISSGVAFLVMEALSFAGAHGAFVAYIRRSKSILKGGD